MNVEAPQPHDEDSSSLHRFSKSGWMTPALIGLVCAALLLATFEHTRGNIHHLREKVETAPEPGPPTGPGGQDPVRLTRHMSEGGAMPQFLSATLLPGRGFNVWQLTAFLPGHGEVPLLVAPPVEQAASVLTGAGDDANGSGASRSGGAFLAPWAAMITGDPAPGTGMLQTLWHNQKLTFPSSGPDSLFSAEGLLLRRGADAVKTSATGDGGAAEAVFHAGSFSGEWPSSTDLTIRVELSGPNIILSMTAKNAGSAPEPFGMGWQPHFAIPSGDRAQAMLVIPSTSRLEAAERRAGVPGGGPSGKAVSTTGTPSDFIKASGTRLGNASIDDTFLDLHTGALSDGPIAEFHDPKSGYGLRIIPVTTTITNFHVLAPADKPWVSIAPNTNVPDPFGREWDALTNTGMVVLQPGETLEWRVRLEIFATTATADPLAQ